MGVLTIDIDDNLFGKISAGFLVPFVIVFIVWCVLLSKYFQWRPFLVARYCIAHGLGKDLKSCATTFCVMLWWIFFILPFLITLGYGLTTAVLVEPEALGVSICVIAWGLLLLLLAFKYHEAQGFRTSKAVITLLVFACILLFGGYIAMIYIMSPKSWMGSGYLYLMPSLVIFGFFILFHRRKLMTAVLPKVYSSEENKKQFITDLEADKFEGWFEGQGKMTIWSSLVVLIISVVCGIGFYYTWKDKTEETATIGTVAASTLVDVLLLISQFQTKDNLQTLALLFLGYVVKMVAVSFSSKYWFVGHGFLFLILGTYYIIKFLDWIMITIVVHTMKHNEEVQKDLFEKSIMESIQSLNPEYKRPGVVETILTVVSLILLVAAAAVEIGVYDSSDLKILSFDLTQRDSYIALIILAVVLGCVCSVLLSIRKNKYHVTWPMVAVFVIGTVLAGCFFYLFEGLEAFNDLRILIFLIFYYVFGTLFEAMIIYGNDMKLIKPGGFLQFHNIISIFFLVLDIVDAIGLILFPALYGDYKYLGAVIFFGISTIFLFIGFCVAFLRVNHFTLGAGICLLGYIVMLAGLCITIFVETEGYFICVGVAGVFIAVCLIIFAVLWTWVMDWRFTKGPCLIISIVAFVCCVISAYGYLKLEEYDTYCLLIAMVMFVIFFGSIAYFVLNKNDFLVTKSVIVLSVLMGIFVILTVVGLFFEIKSFFASLSALLLIIYICCLLVIGGFIATTSKTDVIIFNNFYFPIRRLFNGRMTRQGFLKVINVIALVIPWIWGMLACALLKWPQFGSLAVSAGFSIFLFMVYTFMYDFDSKALNSVEYMQYDAIEFAVNKAITISGNEVDDDALPPKDEDTYEGFMEYANARKAMFEDQSKFESALKAQLYITAEIAFDRIKEKVDKFCAERSVELSFLKQSEFTAAERKLIFLFGDAINKSSACSNSNKEREDYLKFVHEQEEMRQAKLAESLRDAKAVADQYTKVIGSAIKEKKFADPKFHPAAKIQEKSQNLLKNVEWKRGEDVFKGQFTGKANPNELCQGSIGDCYLVSAMAAISGTPKHVENIFEKPIKITETGAACVKMNAMGEQIKILVDSQLPFKQGTTTAKFVQPRDIQKSSWWYTIVEKAYAKQNGSYSAIIGGNSHVALNRLLGGWPENFDLDSLEMKEQINNGELWKNLLKWHADNDYLCAGSHNGSDTDKNDKNIVLGHAYSILNVQEIKGFKLLQMRNPWGSSEWNGAWSDKSPLWQQHPDVAKALGHADVDDGMFWIDFKNFCANYSTLYICLDLASKKWKYHDIKGKFEPGNADGAKPVTKGPGANLLTQYLVKFNGETKVRLTFEKTGPDCPCWVYAIYNKGQQVKKILKGMQYKTEAVAPNAVLQSFEWDIPANQVEFPWTFVVCRNKLTTKNDWMLRLWVTRDIDTIDDIKPSEASEQPASAPKAAIPKQPAPAAKPAPAPAPKAAPKPAPKPAVKQPAKK